MTLRLIQLTEGDAMLDAASDLFESYRVHYGQAPAPARTRAWLGAQVAEGRLRLDAAVQGAAVEDAAVQGAAVQGESVCGIVTSTAIPASLTARTAWLVRDLFVHPEHRRAGVAVALLLHLERAARAEGVLRLSLQTETDNEPALALYARLGYRPETSLVLLNRPLDAQDGPADSGSA